MAIQPLAYRMRPKALDEIVGQTHLVGKDKIIYRMVKSKTIIFYDIIRAARNWKNLDCKCDCWKYKICIPYIKCSYQ